MNELKSTPLISYDIKGRRIWVKREDLCAPIEWPPFSKLRGLPAYLLRQKLNGITTVGHVETSISMAGWGVCAVAQELGMKAVIYDPQYVNTKPEHETLQYHRDKWASYPNTTVEPVAAGRAKVNWYMCRKRFYSAYPRHSELLPLGIPFEETIKETAREYWDTVEMMPKLPNSVVCCIGSGTIFAGLIRGTTGGTGILGRLYGVMTRTGSVRAMEKKVLHKSNTLTGGLFPYPSMSITNPGWEYTAPCDFPCPFPCNPYYDRKAWMWLIQNLNDLPDPVLFWNIGSSPIHQ